MPIRNRFHRCLQSALVALPVTLLIASISHAGEVDRIQSQAKEGEFVTVTGFVVSVSEKKLFTLEDASGEQILAVIPDFLQRTAGTPEVGETIRVSGKYDHRTLLDEEKSHEAERDRNWGIRVATMERKIPSSGRNPTPDPALTHADKAPGASPAAPATAVTIATPDTGEDLKNRLIAARKHVLKAKQALGDAKAETARGIYRNVAGAEKASLAANQTRAQQEYDAAVDAIEPLVEEARSSGMDPKMLELYGEGVTR